jgi:hypothetical protein
MGEGGEALKNPVRLTIGPETLANFFRSYDPRSYWEMLRQFKQATGLEINVAAGSRAHMSRFRADSLEFKRLREGGWRYKFPATIPPAKENTLRVAAEDILRLIFNTQEFLNPHHHQPILDPIFANEYSSTKLKGWLEEDKQSGVFVDIRLDEDGIDELAPEMDLTETVIDASKFDIVTEKIAPQS